MKLKCISNVVSAVERMRTRRPVLLVAVYMDGDGSWHTAIAENDETPDWRAAELLGHIEQLKLECFCEFSPPINYSPDDDDDSDSKG